MESRERKLDLKNYQITVRELLSDPQARQLLQREFPKWCHSPLISLVQNMTLQGVLGLAKPHVPVSKINRVLSELEQI